MDTMHIAVDRPALRKAAMKVAAKKEGQVESQGSQGTLSGSQSKKRPREDANDGSELRSAKRVHVESGLLRTCYPRKVKKPPVVSDVAPPQQASGAGSQTKTPQEKAGESKSRDPILQTGCYAIEMVSMNRVTVWNFLIIGTCVSFRSGSLF